MRPVALVDTTAVLAGDRVDALAGAALEIGAGEHAVAADEDRIFGVGLDYDRLSAPVMRVKVDRVEMRAHSRCSFRPGPGGSRPCG